MWKHKACPVYDAGADPSHPQWVMQSVVSNQPLALQEALDEASDEGWELVAVHPRRMETGGGAYPTPYSVPAFYLFKRPANFTL